MPEIKIFEGTSLVKAEVFALYDKLRQFSMKLNLLKKKLISRDELFTD